MNQFMGINSLHVDCLNPLLKWKIMDVKSLLEVGDYPYKYSGFAKLIKRLQNFGILNAVVDSFTKKKYVYLTKDGLDFLSTSNKLLIQPEDSVAHDAKASEIVRGILDFESVEKVLLEHEVWSKELIIPDAKIEVEKDKNRFQIAFEFELTRKSKARVTGKVNSYFSQTDFNYVMYFFASKSLFDAYERIIKEEVKPDRYNRVIFVCQPDLFARKYSLKDSMVLFRGEKKTLGEIFCKKK